MDNVNHPSHYTTGFPARPVECFDITRHLSFTVGNAFKYIWRAGKKGDAAKALEDLDKAIWYLDRAAEAAGIEKPLTDETAQAVFDLLVRPKDEFESFRYTALQAVLTGLYRAAAFSARHMKTLLENREGKTCEES